MSREETMFQRVPESDITPRHSAPTTDQYLQIDIGGYDHGIHRRFVKDVLPRGSAQVDPLPAAPRSVVGTMRWDPRGGNQPRTIPVVNLTDRLSLPSTDAALPPVIVVLGDEHHTIGVLAAAIRGAVVVSPADVRPLPDLHEQLPVPCITAGIPRPAGLLPVLDGSRILQETAHALVASECALRAAA
jgi:chemotaxis signal transduction protein